MKIGLNLALSVLLTLLLGGFVFRFLETRHLLDGLAHLDIGWLLLCAASFLAYQLFRTKRLRLLLGGRESFRKLFYTMCLHAFFNVNLPAGLGDAALVYLLKRAHQVGLIQGTSSIIAVRILDMGLFCLLFLWAALAIDLDLPSELILAVAGVLAGALFLGGLAWGFRQRLAALADKSARFASWERWVSEYRQLVERLFLHSNLWRIVGATISMWTAMYFFFYSAIRALGTTMPWDQVLLLYILLTPVSLLPIKGIGNIGTHEAAWFFCLKILGVSSERAALLSFSSHAIFFLVLLVVQLIPISGFLLPAIKGRNSQKAV